MAAAEIAKCFRVEGSTRVENYGSAHFFVATVAGESNHRGALHIGVSEERIFHL